MEFHLATLAHVSHAWGILLFQPIAGCGVRWRIVPRSSHTAQWYAIQSYAFKVYIFFIWMKSDKIYLVVFRWRPGHGRSRRKCVLWVVFDPCSTYIISYYFHFGQCLLYAILADAVAMLGWFLTYVEPAFGHLADVFFVPRDLNAELI